MTTNVINIISYPSGTHGHDPFVPSIIQDFAMRRQACVHTDVTDVRAELIIMTSTEI